MAGTNYDAAPAIARACLRRQCDRDPRNGRLRMSEPRALVEHFFRHEFGRLVAVLTRSLGVRRLDLVEDVVQAALVQALETWSRRGVPEDPAGWLYCTARRGSPDPAAPPATWRSTRCGGSEPTPRQGSAWPKTPSGNCRRSKRISPTRSATNRFACSSRLFASWLAGYSEPKYGQQSQNGNRHAGHNE